MEIARSDDGDDDRYRKMIEGERNIMTASQPMGAEGHDKLFYADDMLILASTAEAAELMLRRVQTESAKYNMRFNQRKCVLLRLNSIHNVRILRRRGGYAGSKQGAIPRHKYGRER